MQTVYKEIITSKSGLRIPVLLNGKTIESRYNPEVDIERKAESIKKDDLFYFVIGLGSGLLISKLLEQNTNANATFLIVENSNDDIKFLKSLPESKKIIEMSENSESRVKICLADDIEKIVPKFYVPALHGNLNIIEQPNYLSVDENFHNDVKNKIDLTLKKIMADFSVQAHFGKIWQKNIMENLSRYKPCNSIDFPIEKTAVVLAAGPSLDSFIPKLISEREKYYIIATDTSYSVCSRSNIVPDAVVSIDGQLVSQSHFFHAHSNSTLFIFDLCANSNVVKKIATRTDKILFANTGHPLAQLAAEKSPCNFLNLFSGSGTVTITALDFAVKTGFKKIEIAGADFSYINGKPYARGTYLDNLYNISSYKTNPSEQTFTKLLYRTELKKLNENSCTTQVLESYKKSLEEYLLSLKINFKKENNIYFIENTTKPAFSITKMKSSENNFSYPAFCKFLSDEYKHLDFSKKSPLLVSLLPYVAHLRISNKNIGTQELLKLALNNMMEYNNIV